MIILGLSPIVHESSVGLLVDGKLVAAAAEERLSYNMHEEPIVCSPEDAIRAFQDGRLEVLAIGDFLVEHEGIAPR